jgi:hypothetical protein
MGQVCTTQQKPLFFHPIAIELLRMHTWRVVIEGLKSFVICRVSANFPSLRKKSRVTLLSYIKLRLGAVRAQFDSDRRSISLQGKASVMVQVMIVPPVLSKINYKKVGAISLVLLLFSILGFVFVPKLLRSQLRNVSSRREEDERKAIFEIDFISLA